MSAYVIMEKGGILNDKHESDEIINYYLIFHHISLAFNAFTAISLSKTAMFWIMKNRFLFVGLFNCRNA